MNRRKMSIDRKVAFPVQWIKLDLSTKVYVPVTKFLFYYI